jgi:hypothetical protein
MGGTLELRKLQELQVLNNYMEVGRRLSRPPAFG